MKKSTIVVFVAVQLLSLSFYSCKKSKKAAPKGMILIPAGEFKMGTNMKDDENKAEAFGLPEPWFKDEFPERKVFVNAFYIDKFEVTNQQYKEYINETGYPAPPDWQKNMYPPAASNYPVTSVNFIDAQTYAKWAKKNIPTEIEWEKAARGTDGRIYPWGNKFDISKANLSRSMTELASKMSVGSFKAGVSPYGVYDMVGNAFEWTSSWFKPYPGSPNAKQDSGNKFMVLRGSSYYYLGHFPGEIYDEVLAYAAMTIIRQKSSPDSRSPDAGFRCIKRIEDQ